MRRLILLAIFASLLVGSTALAAPASEGGAKGPLGVGAAMSLGGLQGAQVVYDPGKFHIEGLLGFVHSHVVVGGLSDDYDAWGLGGRAFFVVHSTPQSDFSLGGGLAILHASPERGNAETNIDLELGAQLRAFIVPNVALSATLGLGLVFADNNLIQPDLTLTDAGVRSGFVLGGQLLGSVGITYFF